MYSSRMARSRVVGVKSGLGGKQAEKKKKGRKKPDWDVSVVP